MTEMAKMRTLMEVIERLNFVVDDVKNIDDVSGCLRENLKSAVSSCTTAINMILDTSESETNNKE